MMTDIRNLQTFALYIQKNNVKFNLFSVTKKMEKKVFVFTLMFLAKHIYPSFMYFSNLCKLRIEYEFDFLRKANAMERICYFLYENNTKNYEFFINIK
ncbi:hypothetical protein E1A91_A03G168200v1 [Gossypium mustelinum]|uniref:Uncharacterized protein n=1 Tax=Gossypium mustelinum TaxID=34275 RepID=A0A5D2ZXC2_GOSMU|nr:hypothetical protein E1A91_A03G168200v1 [Gossypium mustelinum]